MKRPRTRLTAPPSVSGLVVAAAFLAASLTPSLLPRTEMVQGALSGACLATGYAVGVFFEAAWAFLGLPRPRRETAALLRVGVAAILVLVAAVTLPTWIAGQNDVRGLMGLPLLETARLTNLIVIAALVAAGFVLLARALAAIRDAVAARLQGRVPGRVAVLGGLLVAGGFAVAIGDGIVFRQALRIADSSFREVDLLIEAAYPQPNTPTATGSAASLIAWESLGRRGREFVATAPAANEIARALGGDALAPIRVYAGLGSAATPRERARLALAELVRVGGFERKILVVATPTGTGWMDPASSLALEYLHRGDVATVAVQYSYLTSWLSLLVEPGYGVESARALFDAVYAHWRTLPQDSRPRLYLHGLSLGALSSEASTDLLGVIDDPFDGALWSGPPFRSAGWRRVVADRKEGSPAWLPRYRDGAAIRFANQDGIVPSDGPWGRLRIVYLQYASDPVTFFEPTAAFRRPEWLDEQRGPDVSGAVRWLPVVTFLQLAFDMATATTTPTGFGHVYAPVDYVRAWAAVTGVALPADVDPVRVAAALRDADVSP